MLSTTVICSSLLQRERFMPQSHCAPIVTLTMFWPSKNRALPTLVTLSGMVSSVRLLVIASNSFLSLVYSTPSSAQKAVFASSTVMLSKWQPSIALSPILFTPAGICRLLRPLHWNSAISSKVSRFSGRTICFRPKLFASAWLPSSRRLAGREMDSIFSK